MEEVNFITSPIRKASILSVEEGRDKVLGIIESSDDSNLGGFLKQIGTLIILEMDRILQYSEKEEHAFIVLRKEESSPNYQIVCHAVHTDKGRERQLDLLVKATQAASEYVKKYDGLCIYFSDYRSIDPVMRQAMHVAAEQLRMRYIEVTKVSIALYEHQ